MRSMNLVPPPKRPRSWLSSLPYWAAGLGVACLALTDAFAAPAARLVDSFDDDAYYYFEVARHVVSGQGSSFDGLLPTNGYHPLWLLALLPLFAAVAGKLQALLAAECLGAALFAATVGIFWLFGRRLGRELELACALPILVFCRELWLSGMETALLLPLLLLAAGYSVADGVFTRRDARLGPAAAALAAALLARLDLVFFVALLSLAGGFLPPGLHFRQRFERIARLAGPAAAALLIYMAANQLLFGAATPVSGQAKSLGGPFWNGQVFAGYLQARPVLGPLFDRLPVYALWLLFLLPALALGIFALRRGRSTPALYGATALLGVLLAANLVQLLYYAVFSSWPLWRWYHYYVPVALALAVAILAGLALAAMPAKLRGRLAAALPILLAAGISAKLGASFLNQRTLAPAEDANYKIQAWAAAEKLNRELPPEAVLAMGDRAGAFGYFLDRPLVQVEGLVASPEFLLALAEGRVHPLLARLGVDYVVYSGGPRSGGDPQAAETPGCAEFTEPKWGSGPKYRTTICAEDLVYRRQLAHPGAMGGTTAVWVYRPELNR
jgi:hypothetical protein